jgi:aminoglycoside 2'-N-acetyltransferase I
MRIVSYPERDVPIELRIQMVALQRQAWPSDAPLEPGPWHDQALNPVSVLLLDNGDRVLSALDVLSKGIAHRGRTYRASGISAMVTHQAVRRMGHGRKLARSAKELMADSGADLGIFTCDRELKPFYEAASWKELRGTVLIGGTREDPFPSDQFDKVTVAAFFSEAARAAEPDWHGARIELFSGEIDKLW